MKTSLILSACGVALVAGTLVYLNRREAPPMPAPAARMLPVKRVASPARVGVTDEEPLQKVSQVVGEPPQAPVATSAPSEVKSSDPIKPDPRPTPFSQAIDTLVASQASLQEKQAAWRQLRESGQLDQAIKALKQGAAEHPTSAAYPAELGQAQLQKAGVIARSGGRISDMGILGMQADQNFDAALKLDPSNWEAQFFKAAAMSHWPPELNKGQEVIQRFSRLIDQQESMSPQPQFAQTYVLLGDQYKKMGKPDYAEATWQLGAAKFPSDPVLLKRIEGQ